MKAKIKANRILDRYENIKRLNDEQMVECALIAVDEIVKALKKNDKDINIVDFNYWKKVKYYIKNWDEDILNYE